MESEIYQGVNAGSHFSYHDNITYEKFPIVPSTGKKWSKTAYLLLNAPSCVR
jgi:hypothetical protein